MQKYSEIKIDELCAELTKMEIPFSADDKKPALWAKYKEGVGITKGVNKPIKKIIKGYKYRLRVKRYTLNAGNIVITNDGHGNTIKLNDRLARRIIAKGDAHLLDIIPVYA